MKYLVVIVPLISVFSCTMAWATEVVLPADEKTFVSLIKRAFDESDASILVQLTFRGLPNGQRVDLKSIERNKRKLIGRGMRDITVARIDPPTCDVTDHHLKIRTCLPAEWSVTVWHAPQFSTTFFAGRVDGKVRILVQDVVRE